MSMRRQPPNKALKLTKPAKERAPRHYAVQDDASCRVARFSLMWASQLNAVFDGHWMQGQ
jgi:hypothetical protein